MGFSESHWPGPAVSSESISPGTVALKWILPDCWSVWNVILIIVASFLLPFHVNPFVAPSSLPLSAKCVRCDKYIWLGADDPAPASASFVGHVSPLC